MCRVVLVELDTFVMETFPDREFEVKFTCLSAGILVGDLSFLYHR